ncbi:hypothetical protein QYF61_013339 [Mycteria americana]|uniref:Uncharacterized protein n=1 Tax=Mycteria americana TaxID=33587 RepID=A0AAN7RW31_MYCAM|nr:hypothetical protein QYF61_013339 [Mycteria americana]
MAIPTSATNTAVTPTPPATGTAAESGNQPVPVSVDPIHKKKSWKRKSTRLEREDEKAGPSQGEEEEKEELMDEMETTRSLSLNELRDMRRDFSHRPGEHVDRYPFKEDPANSQSEWTTIEGGSQYLRELAVVEVIYSNLDDNQGEDMRKWDGEPTWRLEARVQELQEKTTARRHPSRKFTAPVSVGA